MFSYYYRYSEYQQWRGKSKSILTNKMESIESYNSSLGTTIKISKRKKLPPKLSTASFHSDEDVSIGIVKTLNPETLANANKSLPYKNQFLFDECNLTMISILGSGAFGSVHKVRYEPTGLLMAQKILKLDPENKNENDMLIIRELNILLQCNCPNIVEFYGSFQVNNQINIMLEYMDMGTLEDLYLQRGPIPLDSIAVVSLHILRGLLYLEENNQIVHRGSCPLIRPKASQYTNQLKRRL